MTEPWRDGRILEWLLAGDPSVRWQVMRDLTNECPEVTAGERHRIASSGWGRQLLDERTGDGRWGGGLYSPKWTSTTYTLLLLRRLGLDPKNEAARESARLLIDKGRWVDGVVVFWRSTDAVELCVAGLVLSIVAYFGIRDDRVDEMVRQLESRQRADGSWFDIDDVANKPFHTAIAVLEGLEEYRRQVPDVPAVHKMIDAGQEFLLSHHLFRSTSSGEVIDPAWTRFSFPPRWHFDVLRALDHFRAAGAPYDARLDDALDLVQRRRQPDGTWRLQNNHPGRIWFDLEQTNRPSRWNTLRALRVLSRYRPRGMSTS